MIDMKPLIATCEEFPEYNISVESHSDIISLYQPDGIIEIASAQQAHDLVTIIRAAMVLNGWEV